MPLLIIFVILPIAEMWVLIETGSHIGGLNTIALVLLTALIGAACLRQQGMSLLLDAQRKMQTGQLPAAEMLGGLMLAIAGVCLVTPGFITDSFGFALLLPPVRQLAAKAIMKKLMSGANATFQYQQQSARSDFHQGPFGSRHSDDIIEGEVVDSDQEKDINNNRLQ